jgi:hypothetical protein
MERASCRGVAWVVILFQETRELIPIEPPPAGPQAGEKFEFAACENRHKNALDCLWGFAPKHRVFAHGRARDRPTSRPRSGQLELNRVFRLIVVNGSSRPQSLRTYSASSAEIANLDSSPGPSLGTGEFIEPMDGTGGSDQDQVTTSFAFQRIACRCRANMDARQHTLRFRCQAHLEPVCLRAGIAHAGGCICAAGVRDCSPAHCQPVSIRAPSIRRHAALAVHFGG